MMFRVAALAQVTAKPEEVACCRKRAVSGTTPALRPGRKIVSAIADEPQAVAFRVSLWRRARQWPGPEGTMGDVHGVGARI